MLTSQDLTFESINDCRVSYQENGIAILKTPVLNGRHCKQIVSTLIDTDLTSFHHRKTGGEDGQVVDYTILDTYQMYDYFDFMLKLYLSMNSVVTAVCGKETILSPYALSAANLCVYQKGQTIGHHYDTNPVSCLIFVSGDSPLIIETFNGSVEICPPAGTAAFFQGRKCLHWVPPVAGETLRVTSPMNYYHSDDTYRPSYIDKISYYGMSYEDATR